VKIDRTELTTGGKDRTKREEDIVSLFKAGQEMEPEQYWDISASTGWAWLKNPELCTFTITAGAIKGFLEPFAILDSQKGKESEGGGVATYPFNNQYVPLSDKRDEEGELIIDMNPSNADERIAYFMSLYPQLFQGGKPVAGGTEAMSAIEAGDEHFMDEFGDRKFSDRPFRGRVFWSDGILNDIAKVRRYLSQAKLGEGPTAGYGDHGQWIEAWAVGILGEGPDEDGNDPGKDAYNQFQDLAKDHPWIHSYYFQGVKNGAEISEDMAIAVVPGSQG
jgi:hypothetical protein